MRRKERVKGKWQCRERAKERENKELRKSMKRGSKMEIEEEKKINNVKN